MEVQMKWRELSILSGIALMCACTQAPAPRDPAADIAEVAKVREGYQAAFNSGNTAAVAAYLTADAYDMENTMPTMVGGAAVDAGLKGMLAEMASANIEIVSQKTDVSGDLAYDRGTFKTTMTPKAGGAPVVEEGRYLVVLRRQTDSTWKLVELMGNSAVPMMPPVQMKK
jgi:ketosteroid isomerase-like protein